jgi:hypothetical protein
MAGKAQVPSLQVHNPSQPLASFGQTLGVTQYLPARPAIANGDFDRTDPALVILRVRHGMAVSLPKLN